MVWLIVMMEFMRWWCTIDRSPIEGRGKAVVRHDNDLDDDYDHDDDDPDGDDDDQDVPKMSLSVPKCPKYVPKMSAR